MKLKKIKENIIGWIIVTAIAFVLFGLGYITYKIWRAEHPNDATWTFFVSKK